MCMKQNPLFRLWLSQWRCNFRFGEKKSELVVVFLSLANKGAKKGRQLWILNRVSRKNKLDGLCEEGKDGESDIGVLYPYKQTA